MVAKQHCPEENNAEKTKGAALSSQALKPGG